MELSSTEIRFGPSLITSAQTRRIEVENTTQETGYITFSADQPIKLCNTANYSTIFCLQPGENSLKLDRSPAVHPAQKVSLEFEFIPQGVETELQETFELSLCRLESCKRTIILRGYSLGRGFGCHANTDFNIVAPGDCARRTIQCESYAIEPLTVSGWSWTSSSAPNFVVRGFSPQTLQYQEKAQFEVEYCPQNLQKHTAGLQLEISQPGNPTPEDGLFLFQGSGGGPQLSTATQTIDFKLNSRQTVQSQRLEITNRGASDLSILRAEIVDNSEAAFSILSQLPQIVPPGGRYALKVVFQPRRIGQYRAQLRLRSNDPHGSIHSFELSAASLQLPECLAAVFPSKVDFGTVPPGQERDLAVQIDNRGQSDCLLTEVSLTQSSTTTLTIVVGQDLPITIPPGTDKILRMHLEAPSTPGNISAQLSLGLGYPANPQQTIPIAAQVDLGAIEVLLENNDFGLGAVGCKSLRPGSVAFKNTSSSDIEILEVKTWQVAVDSPRWASPFEPRKLSPGQSEGVIFDHLVPERTGDLWAQIEIQTKEGAIKGKYLGSAFGRAVDNLRLTDTFYPTSSPKVDVLVVPDRPSLHGQIPDLRDTLLGLLYYGQSAAWDFHFGTISANLESSATAGRLLPLDGTLDERVLTNETKPPNGVIAKHLDSLRFSSGPSEALKAAYLALQPEMLATHNAGFLRSDAFLHIVLVSRNDDEKPEQLDRYLDYFWRLKDRGRGPILGNSIRRRGFRTHALTTLAGSSCGFQVSYGYLEAIRRSLGVASDICRADTATQRLAETLFSLTPVTYPAPKDSYFLSYPPKASTITVKVGNRELIQPIDWIYDANNNAIRLRSVPEEAVDVEYEPICLE